MQEYIRKDRNGAELKVGDKVNRIKGNEIVGSGEVKPPQYTSPWAHEKDIVWIEWETATREYEDNIGKTLWYHARHVEKIVEEKDITPMKPHVHVKLIKMWADDPTIKFQFRESENGNWKDCIGCGPVWYENYKYRVKPKEKKVVSKYKYSLSLTGNGILHTGDHYSDEEWIARLEKHPVKHFTKLEWTKKEFEVEG